MDRYDLHRLVSWVAHHVAKGEDLGQILSYNAGLKVPHDAAQIRQCFGPACQAVRNAELVEAEMARRSAARQEAAVKGLPPPIFPPLRLCDITGCKYPTLE